MGWRFLFPYIYDALCGAYPRAFAVMAFASLSMRLLQRERRTAFLCLNAIKFIDYETFKQANGSAEISGC